MPGISGKTSSVSQEVRLHLGCERITPPGWIHLDGSWGAWLAKHQKIRTLLHWSKLFPRQLVEKNWDPDILVHDLRKPLPFADNSVGAIYASHVLEHIYLTEAKKLLNECYRILTPGGVLRVVVPDLHAMVLEYVAGNAGTPKGSQLRADRLNQQLSLRSEAPPAGSLVYKIYSILKDFHSHKWMYDADSLTYYLEQASFTEIRVMPAHESLIRDITEIEQAERVADGAGVCIEGIKPV